MNATIPLRVVQTGPQAEPYRLFVVSSLLMASLAGLVLAIHIPLGRLLDWSSEARRPDIIATHGQVQLLGFAGLFVMGMSLRLMPRFAGARLQLEGLVVPAWGLIFGAMVTRAFVQLWLAADLQGAMMIGTQFALLIGTACFTLIVAATLLMDENRAEATAYFFLLGSLFAFLQAAMGTFIAIHEAADGTRVFSYVPNMAMLYVQLVGFLLMFVAGVATRAVPTLVGLPRPDRAARAAALSIALAVLILAGALLWLEYVEYSGFVAAVSDLAVAALGPLFLWVVWLSGIFRPAANRVRPASRAQFWLVRAAFGWLAFAGVLALYFGCRALLRGGLPTFFQLDALRHVLGAGVITMLIVGMSLLILPEFATERQTSSLQRVISTSLLVLLNSATLLRVLPSLFGTAWTADARSLSMAVAGGLAEAAILLFALRLVSLMGQRRIQASVSP